MAASKFLIKQETSLTNCANNEKEHTKGTVLLCCKPRDFGNLIFI